jgi:hypothetical protein
MKLYHHVVAAYDDRHCLFYVRVARSKVEPAVAEKFVKETHCVEQAVCINIFEEEL